MDYRGCRRGVLRCFIAPRDTRARDGRPQSVQLHRAFHCCRQRACGLNGHAGPVEKEKLIGSQAGGAGLYSYAVNRGWHIVTPASDPEKVAGISFPVVASNAYQPALVSKFEKISAPAAAASFPFP